VMDKVVLGQDLLQVLQFSPCQYHCTIALHTRISLGGRTVGLLVAAVQRCSLTPSTTTLYGLVDRYQHFGGT
jgi:hypothetical protein